MAIGGLRNIADCVSRLTYPAEFGSGLGEKSRTLLLGELKTPRPQQARGILGYANLQFHRAKDDAVPLARPTADGIEAARNLMSD